MKICVFIGDMYRDFAMGILKQLDFYAREKGYRIDVFGICSMPTKNPLHVIGYKSILSLPNVHEYDGVILCYDTLIHEGVAKDLVEDLLADNDAPPVVCIRAEISGFYNVVPDNRVLMHDIAKHVIEKCKTNDIGFVTGRDDLDDSIERRLGFEDAMREAGKKLSDKKIFHGNYWSDQGPEMADFFIKKNGKLPEAIICSNDYEAIALCNELRKRGYTVPQDVMISGVDNAQGAADHIPSITTIEISNAVFVDTAIEVLEDVIAGKKPDLNIYVPGTLILRESTNDLFVERDIFSELLDLTATISINTENMRDYVVIGDLFEGALTKDSGKELTLEQFKTIDSMKSCYICRYREENRELVGYFTNRGDNKVCSISYPSDRVFPDGFEDDKHGMRVHFPLAYKNEIYGYLVAVFNTDMPNFINFKVEYLLMQVAANMNKFELYEKLFGISDVMTLYITDPLTETLNRRGFEKKISEKFDKDGKMIKEIAVVSIDMDDLKIINDTYGHNAGDDAIKETAQCIDKSLNKGEFVARMGGDEFEAVLVISEPGRVGKFIRNVRNNIRQVNLSGKYPFELSASIGTCEVQDWHGVAESMKKADKAMYLEKKAKKKGRS